MQSALVRLYLSGLLAATSLTRSFSADATSAMTLRSTENRTTLVELYTSEGCSSCPPAESWLSRLTNSPGLWRDFVPVAFHVDYWDYLGWRDPWGSKDFSNRQRAYAGAWSSGSIYTPGFVLNGKEWRDWSGAGLGPSPKSNVGILQATSNDGEHWQFEFKPSTPKATRYQVHAALLGSALVSDVKAGENSGRRLAHDFVVLNLLTSPMAIENGAYRAVLALSNRQRTKTGRPAIALWITAEGQMEPLQAVGAWLVSATK
jgi:hypothetical protein